MAEPFVGSAMEPKMLEPVVETKDEMRTACWDRYGRQIQNRSLIQIQDHVLHGECFPMSAGTDLVVTSADLSQGPHWQLFILWAAFIGIVSLVVAVKVLVLQLEVERGKIMAAGTCPVKCNSSSDDFMSFLRSRFCNQGESTWTVNSSCQICPQNWRLHPDKCYWLSVDLKSWNDSHRDCSKKGAQLTVIQDKEDMEFLKWITENGQSYWIGLSLSSSEKKWVWVTGHPLDQNLFQEPPSSAGDGCCARIKNGKIQSETCTAIHRWVCQKDPILL
ncbi:killer cell lectin-like receptor subfamily B member 1B allele C [Eublepharis macularius]|uniref:Killer cell lectin-like receptor subfamily B member 1B allele C n=1 Tax=Eublepharis macularius TaxID=481883 RepID=A0AA97J6D0_EUBMA|nr:killer cell lectin-like receptor subfamily B member 1B allele C [Eublepharis macularius]